MSRLILLFLTIVLDILFMCIRPDSGMVGFLISGDPIRADAYMYFVMEHLSKILFFVVIWGLEKEFRVAAAALLALEFIDLIDFVLTYNAYWGSRYLSINTFKAVAFGAAVAYESRKRPKK